MRTCPNCGEELPERMRLCGYCGALLDPVEAPPEVRKVVSIVFSDLAGSTALGERLDSESLRAVLDRYFLGMRRALEAHGGTIEKFIGDAVMAVFGLPVLHEDDALRAVRAAWAMTEELAVLNEELEERYGVRLVNRTGVNTGEVIAGDPSAGQRYVTGDAVNVAARLEQAAPPSGVLLGELTHRLVRSAVVAERVEPLELKGKSERVPAYRLQGLAAPSPVRAVAPLVGRDSELAALTTALDEVTATGRCRLRLLVAGAGLGKSRLLEEFTGGVGITARVLNGRALPYGRGTTFWPLSELIRSAAAIGDDDPPEVVRAALASLVGLEGQAIQDRLEVAMGLSAEPFPLEELYWAARKLLERLAAGGPVVAVFEDLHWAQPSFLRLLEHLVETVEAPVLLLGSGRREVLDLDPGLAGEGADGQRVTIELAPLSPADTARVLTAAGGAPLPAPVQEAVLARAAGNPLFAEQIVSMLVEDGRLRRVGDGWRMEGRLSDLDVPPTIQALLAARLDQLAPDERGVLEPAAVIGLQFDAVALRAIAAQAVRPRVDGLLGGLVGKQLVAPLGSPVASIDTYRFEHAMIRDSAYGRLLKRRRAQLHEQLVDWAEEARADRIGGKDLDEVLGYHLEQAHRYLRELGPLDGHGRTLGRRASALLADAGRRAFAREDMPSAADLLERAVDALETDEAGRPELLLPLAEALMHSGRFDSAQARLGELTDPAAAVPAAVRATAQVMRVLVRAQVGEPGEWVDAIVAEARRSVPVLDGAGDEAGLAAVTRWVAWAHGTANRYADMAAAAEEALGHAVLAADERQRRRASVLYAMAATYGPTPVPEAISRCREILARTNVDRGTQGVVMGLLARLVAMDGDFEQARGLYRSAQGLLRELGGGVSAAASSLDSFEVERLAGDVEAAAAELRRDRELLAAMGETYLRSTITAYLAKLLAEAGRLEEAAPLAEEARSIADEEDVATQAVWRLATARVLAAEDPERAEALVAEALALVRATDARLLEAEALQDLALVQRATGREASARTLLEQASAIRRAKGDVVGSAGVEALLAELAGAESWRVLGRAGLTAG